MVNVIIALCGDEAVSELEISLCALSKQTYKNFRCYIACAQNVEIYYNVLENFEQEEKKKFEIIDFSKRDFLTVSQLKNAALKKCDTGYISWMNVGEEWAEDYIEKIINFQNEISFEQLLKAGNIKNLFIDKSVLCSINPLNARLITLDIFELCIRAYVLGYKDKIHFEIETDYMPSYEAEYETYAYLIGRYVDILKQNNTFDAVLMHFLNMAQQQGTQEYFVAALEKMLAKDERFKYLDEATKSVLIYMGDPICGDVLTGFANSFINELKANCLDVKVYNMRENGVAKQGELVGNTYRAVIGFQTALFSTTVKDSSELINNMIEGPKINFLYDHPLYLYYHFTLPLKRYFVLTQDADYAKYINTHYPLIKKSYHLPPAGNELTMEDLKKEYDVVFVASYHNYRERMMAIDVSKEPVKEMANKLLDVMKENPNLTAEEALKIVLDNDKRTLNDEEFCRMLTDCMDACRVVMFFYREKIIELLVNAGIKVRVYGDSWKECPLKDSPNLIICPSVSYEEGIKEIAKARISLNIMSWHKAGMTERIANTMLAKTLCLTDRTKYLDTHFENGTDYVCFDLERLYELPELVKALLKDDDKINYIAANGYKKAKEEHCWENRVDEFLAMLDNDVFEG